MKQISLFFLFLLPVLAFGQKKPKCSVSPGYGIQKLSFTGLSYNLVVSPDGKTAVKVYQDKKQFIIQYYDALTMVLKKETVSSNNGVVVHVLDIGHYDGKLMLIYKKRVWSAVDIVIACREINTQNYTLGEEKILIENEENLRLNPKLSISSTTSHTNKKNQDSFLAARSQDGSKLMLHFLLLQPEEKNDKFSHDILSFYIFDEKLELFAQENITMPYPSKQMINHSFYVNSKGVPYMLIKVSNDDNQPIDDDATLINYHFELLRIDLSNHNIIKTRIEAKGKHLTNLKLLEDSNKNIICAGTYINANKRFALTDIHGMCLFRINKKGIASKAFHELPLELLTLYESKKDVTALVKKDKKGLARLHNFSLSSIFLEEDNGVVFSGQETYIHSSQTTTWYQYNSMIAVKIGGDNKLAWMKKLPKRQVSSYVDNSFSFQHLKMSNKHYFLFLDHEKNDKVPEDEVPTEIKNRRACYLRAFIIDGATGSTKKIALFNTHDIKDDIKITKLPIAEINSLPDNQLIMQVEKQGKENCLIKVKL